MAAEDVLPEVTCVDAAVTDGLLGAGGAFLACLLSVVLCLHVVVPTMPKQPVDVYVPLTACSSQPARVCGRHITQAAMSWIRQESKVVARLVWLPMETTIKDHAPPRFREAAL